VKDESPALGDCLGDPVSIMSPRCVHDFSTIVGIIGMRREDHMYQLFLFLHIVGALGLFAAIALEWTSLARLRRATTVGQAREWIGIAASLGRVYGPSMLVLLVSGITMTATAWAASGMAAMGWIVVSFIAMIALSAVGAGLTRRPIMAMVRALDAARDAPGPVSAELSRHLRNPVVWVSVQTRAAIALGIVFCMSVKPDLAGAVLAITAAATLGVAASLPAYVRSASSGAQPPSPRHAP
jgi:hypothetical protein